MASDGLGDDDHVIKGGRVGADIFRVAGEDLRWAVQGGGHHDELVERIHQRALARYGPVDGELLAVALLAEQAGIQLRHGPAA
jgi:hypothetical protein